MTRDPAVGHLNGQHGTGTLAFLARGNGSLTIREAMAGRDNGLNALRFVMASTVIISHGFPINGRGEDPFLRRFKMQENLGGVAVVGFFAASGYLITLSAGRKDIMQYFWARALRIFPAFWTLLVVTTALFGPLLWLVLDRGTLQQYFMIDQQGPFSYIFANADLTMRQYTISGVLDGSPYPQALNGSLWTLQYEWACYLLIGILVLFSVMRYTKIIIPLLTSLFLILQSFAVFAPGSISAAPIFSDPQTVRLGYAFLCGTVLAVISRRIRIDHRLGLLSVVLSGYTLLYGGFEIVGFPAMAYALLWLSAIMPQPLRRWGSRNDYSYGIYIYGFISQQLVCSLGLGGRSWALYSVNTIAAFFLA